MPKITQKNRVVDQVVSDSDLVELSERIWEEFDDSDQWQRSKKSNLWRNWAGKTVSIFQRDGDGWYAWCIAGEDSKRFSPGAFETEAEAIESLRGALELNEMF